MLILIDYSNDYHENIKVHQCTTENQVLEFVSQSSISGNFKIQRINRYELGRLFPLELKLTMGRMTVEEAQDVRAE